MGCRATASTPVRKGLELPSMVPVCGGESCGQSDKSDGKQRKDDGSEADVRCCTNRGEVNLRGVLHEVLAVHSE